MRRFARTGSRSALVAALALSVASLAAPFAGAASGDIEFSCNYSLYGAQGEITDSIDGTATGSFDTGIPDGLVVTVPGFANPSPFTGTVTLTDEFTDQLRAAGVTSLDPGDFVQSFMGIAAFIGDDRIVTEDNTGFMAVFNVSSGTVPADGSLSLEVQGDVVDSEEQSPRGFRVLGAGPGTVLGGDFSLESFNADGGAVFSLRCQSDNEFLIDTFQAVTAASPSSTPTDRPVRPVLVQTDFAEHNSAAVSSVLVLGALLTLGGAALALWRVGRVSSRRH